MCSTLRLSSYPPTTGFQCGFCSYDDQKNKKLQHGPLMNLLSFQLLKGC